MTIQDSCTLSTAHLADACRKIGVPVRCAPSGLAPIAGEMRCAGRVRPARHAGGVDVILEALERATPGCVLVVDNGGRHDEACIGDLMALEAQLAGLAGIVIWGLHRDTDELLHIGLPVFSLGAIPTGPQRHDPCSEDALEWARIGSWIVTADDWVACDADGVILLPASRVAEIASAAAVICDKERVRAQQMRSGVTFRSQTHFERFRAARTANPKVTFREHLRAIEDPSKEGQSPCV